MTNFADDYAPYDFANLRHIGPSKAEMADMLKVIGAADLEELIDQTLPQNIRAKAPLAFGVIQRNILENPAWYTAYTPYQPEISQGRLEALLNFQTVITDLTGLEIANASLLDEATACAEAMTMAQRISKSKAKQFFVDENCHPQNIAVMQTRAAPLGIEITIGHPDDLDASAVFGAIFQVPGTYGDLRDVTTQMAALHEHKGIGIVSADPLSLMLLKAPGEMGADIAVGSTQRFGVPMGYGGPHAAYMATRLSFARTGLPAIFANPRTAYSPRKSDL